MRGLLCVPQSSKERLRRSRTESSGAAPAIEELPGTARQCKARRAASGFVSTDFRLLTGARGLEGARPSSSPEYHFLSEVRISASASPAHHRSRKYPFRYCLLPSEEVWRAPGPPAPPTIIFSRKFEYPPPPRPRPAVAGIAHFGTISSYRRGLEGVRPSSSPEYHFHTEVQHISLIPPTCRSICNQLSICYSKTMEQGENQDGSYAEKI